MVHHKLGQKSFMNVFFGGSLKFFIFIYFGIYFVLCSVLHTIWANALETFAYLVYFKVLIIFETPKRQSSVTGKKGERVATWMGYGKSSGCVTVEFLPSRAVLMMLLTKWKVNKGGMRQRETLAKKVLSGGWPVGEKVPGWQTIKESESAAQIATWITIGLHVVLSLEFLPKTKYSEYE